MCNTKDNPRKLGSGRIRIADDANSVLDLADVRSALRCHFKCDWDHVQECDRLENENALGNPSRLMSVFKDSNGLRFWIITEADYSLTTVLLPQEH